MALIGEAGSGKSLVCMNLVGQLENVTESTLGESADPVVSIFVSLYAVPKLFQDGSLDQYLTSHLGLSDALELECFIESYRLILVLDAVDEVLAFGGPRRRKTPASYAGFLQSTHQPQQLRGGSRAGRPCGVN